MAARVRRVVMAMVTLPGMASGGRKSESQATITKRPGHQIGITRLIIYTPDGR